MYYAGAVDRSGAYGEYQVVDERVVGRKPVSIGFAEAGRPSADHDYRVGITACLSRPAKFASANPPMPDRS